MTHITIHGNPMIIIICHDMLTADYKTKINLAVSPTVDIYLSGELTASFKVVYVNDDLSFRGGLCLPKRWELKYKIHRFVEPLSKPLRKSYVSRKEA